jgi:dTDP-4-dehydrorhamnose 3,5-epimerase
MRFTPTPLPGAWLIEEERRGDSRGWFARSFCAEEFAAQGLETWFPQINHSASTARATLRGMHFQAEPYAEVKVVSCIRGALYDVIVDIREGSPTRGRWHAVELAAGDGKWFYIPKGCAHGFITLADDTEAVYLMSAPHAPLSERGFRFDDPSFNIVWPSAPAILSEKDAAWPPFDHTL